MVRIIHYIANDESGREGLSFTEDLSTDAADHIPYGCKLESDTTLDIDLPPGFPSEHQFEKV
jgi:hypothetical protein